MIRTRSKATVRASLVALTVVAMAGLASCTRSQPAAPLPSQVVLLGLDAGTWDLLDPWIAEGRLPNLARLRDNGAHAVLRSIEPSSSPVIWTSIATGKTPQQHGITWFVRFPDGPGKPAPVNRNMRKARAFWNILTDAAVDMAIVGWFVTWPAEAVSGRLVSDVAHWGAISQESFPEGFLYTLPPVGEAEAVATLPRFMDVPYDPAVAARRGNDPAEREQFLIYDRFIRAYRRDLFYVRAAREILADGPPPELLAVYLRGTDDVQHGFWKYMDPAPFGDVPEEKVRALGRVIAEYWTWIDEQVGLMLAAYERPPLVIVVSDHGAGPAVGDFAIESSNYLHLSGAHRDNGILIVSGPGTARGQIAEASIYDVAPTLLHALGHPVAEDMAGRVLTEAFAAPEPVRTVATYEPQAVADPEPSTESEASPADGQILDHLRSLGYIE